MNGLDKPRIDLPVIVEGKYDKIRLSSVFDCDVIVLNGFSFFRDDGKKETIRKIAEKSRILVLTDSDRAGMFIRTRLRNIVPRDRIIDVYVKPVRGRERRKDRESADGIIGVEGAEKEELLRVFAPYIGGTVSASDDNRITKADLYLMGLSGRPSSAAKRDAVCARLGLPPMSSQSFLDAVNMLSDKETIDAICAELFG
ncbi:MAG: DUF4093 domain-containing protein [Clostridia bacterium]|nr:DUF4093 domain-containing protein [Clostridia bacterium]